MKSSGNKKSKHSKSSNNYKIIRVEKTCVKHGIFGKMHVVTNKVTMTKFYAKDDDDARSYLKEYKKVANRKYDYYFESYSPVYVIGHDGKRREYEDHAAYWAAEDAELGFFRRSWDAISLELWYWFIDVPKNAWFWIKDLMHIVRSRHSIREVWSLDTHILDDILWNVPILIKNRHGIAQLFLDKAVAETHKNEKDFDIKKWNESNHTYTQDEMKNAEKFQNEELMQIIKYIKLYQYYVNFGIVNEDNPDEVEFDRQWKHTLPIIDGTYDSLDYKRLYALTDKYWNKIWEWMRRYGQMLWD